MITVLVKDQLGVKHRGSNHQLPGENKALEARISISILLSKKDEVLPTFGKLVESMSAFSKETVTLDDRRLELGHQRAPPSISLTEAVM